jgi:hypothetical protein
LYNLPTNLEGIDKVMGLPYSDLISPGNFFEGPGGAECNYGKAVYGTDGNGLVDRVMDLVRK